MAKILVVYDSGSGNTEALALAVAKDAESSGNVKVTVKKTEQTKPSDLLAADGIIMGIPDLFWENVR
jgi:NAD(P)H dehydrogenase (quinone)